MSSDASLPSSAVPSFSFPYPAPAPTTLSSLIPSDPVSAAALLRSFLLTDDLSVSSSSSPVFRLDETAVSLLRDACRHWLQKNARGDSSEARPQNGKKRKSESPNCLLPRGLKAQNHSACTIFRDVFSGKSQFRNVFLKPLFVKAHQLIGGKEQFGARNIEKLLKDHPTLFDNFLTLVAPLLDVATEEREKKEGEELREKETDRERDSDSPNDALAALWRDQSPPSFEDSEMTSIQREAMRNARNLFDYLSNHAQHHHLINYKDIWTETLIRLMISVRDPRRMQDAANDEEKAEESKEEKVENDSSKEKTKQKKGSSS